MKKYLKSLISLFLLTLLVIPWVCVGALPAFAQGTLLVDDADLLDDFEEEEVREALQEVSDRWNVDVAVLTVDSMDGEEAMNFTDNYYDEHGYAEDGALFMVCMDEREYWLSTSGTMINALSDMGIDYIGENIASSLSDGDYEQAFSDYAALVDDFVEEYTETGEAYDVDNLPYDDTSEYEYDGDYEEEHGFHLTYLLISLVAGCIVSFLIMRVYKGQVKNVHSRNNAGDYLKRDSVDIYHRKERFLYRNINRVPIPKHDDNDFGGGSSIHMSDGGSSHGGGGGHF